LAKIGDGAGDFYDRSAQPIDGGDHYGVTLAGVVQQGNQAWSIGVNRTGEFVGEDMTGFDPLGGERGELRIEILAQSAYPRVPENRCHSTTVSLPSDNEDLRHAV